MIKRVKSRGWIFVFFIFLIISCKAEEAKPDLVIPIPETQNQGRFYQWGVIKSPLPRLREAPGEESKVINYIPLATVVRILKKDNKLEIFNNETDHWYLIDYDGEQGWIFGSFLEIYNDYEHVKTRCEEILVEKMKKDANVDTKGDMNDN